MDRDLRTKLDGIVKENFVYAIAAFASMVFLFWNPVKPFFPLGDCAPGSTAFFSLFLFVGLSFGSYLLTALWGLSLKHGVLSGQLRQDQAWTTSERVSSGTLFGYIFFILMMINMFQIQVGRFGCSPHTEELAEELVYLVYPALFLGIFVAVYNLLFR